MEKDPDWRKLGGHNLHIPRQKLRKILLDALPEGTVAWGSSIKKVSQVPVDPARPRRHEAGVGAGGESQGGLELEEVGGVRLGDDDGDEVELEFNDGQVVRAAACIGCDGIHSVVRALVLEGEQVRIDERAPRHILSPKPQTISPLNPPPSTFHNQHSRRGCAQSREQLRYLGYIVVLGIFPNSDYPLARQRAFQTSDGCLSPQLRPATPTPCDTIQSG